MKMNFPGKPAFEKMVSEMRVEKNLIMKQEAEAKAKADKEKEEAEAKTSWAGRIFG